MMNETTKQKIDAWHKRRSDRLDNRGIHEDDKWITIGGGAGGKNNNKNSPSSGGKGVHILLNDKNVVVGGAGGKFNGEKFDKVKSYGKAKGNTEGSKTAEKKNNAPKTVTAHFDKSKIPEHFMKSSADKKSFDFFSTTLEGFGKSNAKTTSLFENINKTFDAISGIPSELKHPTSSYKCYFAVVTSYVGGIRGCELKIPQIKKTDSEEMKRMKVRTTLHEMGHMIDFALRKEKGKASHLSTDFEPLINAIAKDSGDVGSEVMDALKKAKEDVKAFRAKAYSDFNEKAKQLKSDFSYKREDGSIDWDKYDKYRKEYKKAENEYKTKCNIDSRCVYDGIDALSDIYDALSGGRLYSHEGLPGHGKGYYSKTSNKAAEIVANFMDISMTSPELCKMLKKDKPELYDACEKIVDEMRLQFGIN